MNINNILNLHLFNETYAFLCQNEALIFISVNSALCKTKSDLSLMTRDGIVHLEITPWKEVTLTMYGEQVVIETVFNNDKMLIEFPLGAIVSLSSPTLEIEPVIFNFDSLLTKIAFGEETSTIKSADSIVEVAPSTKSNVTVVDFNKGKLK